MKKEIKKKIEKELKCPRCNNNGCPACEKSRIKGYLPEEYENNLS